MKKHLLFTVVALGFTVGARAPARASQPVITEFMALNTRTLADEDGDFPDWIEIYNPGETPVNLAGWFLTDDSTHRDKWMFPEMTLPAGRFLLVYASEKDRRDPARNLHTNFRLNSTEYLALVSPDGATVSRFGLRYPPQVEDISYGLALDSTPAALAPPGAPVWTVVPADGNLGLTWTELGFDHGQWATGKTGVGYDARARATYAPLIQTDLEGDMRGINTSAYLRLPFTVEAPGSFNTLVLRMKYEDGFIAYLNQKEVARRNAPPSPAWNSKSPARRAERDALAYEEINLSAHLELLQAGANLLAIHGLNESKTGLSFLILPELEAVDVGQVQTGVERYFSGPTPGSANTEGALGVADPPQFSHPEGAYDESLSLTLSAGSPDGVVRYTVDRSEPTAASKEFTTPISINATTVVRARAFRPGYLPSPIATQTYISLDPSVADFTSNLPLVLINTFGRNIPEDPLVPVYVEVIETIDGRAAITDPPDFIGAGGIKVRGSSSLQFPKKSYTFEVWDEKGNDRDVSILGFPPEADWILYAPYTDKTLMRDIVSYDFSNWIGRWAPQGRFVEVYLSTTPGKLKASDYQGVYVFFEKIKRGPDRVDIQRLYASETTPPGITGGYILKKDRLDPGDAGISTSRSGSLGLVYPREDTITSAQKAYILGFLREFETALYGANFRNPDTGYTKYIDTLSFIDHHILVEMTKNIDGFRLSTFMFKDREGKLNMGPLWDYNLTLGNANYLDGWKPDGWYNPLLSEGDYPWWRRIFQDPAFKDAYQLRWAEIREKPFTADALIKSMDDYAELLAEAQVRNYKKWRILGTYVWPNQFIGKTYEAEMEFMKKWTRDRLAWMDGQFVSPPALSRSGGTVPPDFVLTLTASVGQILYTLDKSDPRLPSGARSPSALTYTGPIPITRNTRVRARANLGVLWSTLREATYVVSTPPLVITEIMYRPESPPPESPFTALDFEFIEIANIGTAPLDLAGVHFTSGIVYDFTGGEVAALPPGGHVVIVKNREAFTARYGSEGITIAGQYTGDLSDVGETITLAGNLDESILKFSYSPSWYPESDGAGHSIVIVDPRGPRDSWGLKQSWRPSTFPGGSPGREDPLEPRGRQVPGDLNQDGILTISDAIRLLWHLVGGQASSLPCDGGNAGGDGNRALLDMNGDQAVEISDAIHFLNYLFQSGPPHTLGTGCTAINGCPDSCAGL